MGKSSPHRPTDRLTDRPKRSTEKSSPHRSTPPNRPTTLSTDRPTDRQSNHRPTDRPRPPVKRRSKEENEQIVIATLKKILGQNEQVPFPSQGELARIGQISKSTVGGYLGREDISKEPLLTRDLIHQLTHK